MDINLKPMETCSMKLCWAFFLATVFAALDSIAAATVSTDEVLVSKDGSDPVNLDSTNYPVKICIGGLGYSRARTRKNHDLCKELKDQAYQACMRPPGHSGDYANLRINGKYSAPPEAVVRLKRAVYQFASGEGSFEFDFRKSDNSIFRIDVAHYGGIAIDPIKNCGKN